MKVIRVKDYQAMSEKAKDFVLALVKNKPDAVLGLATGSTPEGLYQLLIDDHKKNGTSYKNITTFNLDEYIGLDGDHNQSYRYFMNEKLFNHIDIPLEQTHVPNGTASDLDEECQRYEALLKEKGGIDLQILGIGTNGHIGFNEPGTPFDSRTHVVELEESTRQANSRFFDSIDDVPTHAITMGVATILESRKIILLASGESKKEAIQKLLTEEPSEAFTASALLNHPDVTVIVDAEALPDTNLPILKQITLEDLAE
ncbi:MAG: glucosamine-6-phosphate deaminase [Caldibacillus sp.]